ncbi:MAG: SIR2 family protein [Methylovulum sp.]
MKFTPGKAAPNIPRELMEAQENDNLVFFCGAGISYPAGLPLFKGLVDEVYQELATVPTEQEQTALNQWRYDTALELLERRFHSEDRVDKHIVRKAIANRLTLKSDANLDTHKAILLLAKTKQQKYRLVTTNFDHGFVLAEPATLAMSDAAPKLPVPKPHKWQSIVYLHGIIDEESDPNSEHLIFTSGDFGAAYLTERWASRFVSELFRHFTVLFVGYSIDDPVMRYMTDAIAADRRRGYTHLKQPYVLAGVDVKKQEFDSAHLDWEAKGVIPLLYDDKNHHIFLHETLQEWAAYCRDGLDSIERIIKEHASKPPLQPYEHDESVQLVIESLKKEDKENYAAKKFFAVASIDWLPVLEKEGLLAMPSNNHHHSLTHNIDYDLIQPHQVTFTLWNWLIEHHLESKQFLEWMIGKNANLHPEFIQLINWKLQNKPPQEPYLTFWRVTALKLSHCVFTDIYQEFPNLKAGRDSLNLSALLRLFEPKITFSKSFSWDGGEPSIPYQADIVIDIDSWHFGQLSEYYNEMTSMLLPITNALKQAMEFWQLLGQADDKYDPSDLYLASISPHHQNHRFHNWTFLIELCRDLWTAAYQTNKPLALAVLEVWKTIPFPVFKRLIFHAYANSDCATPTEKLSTLLTDNHWWLWSVSTKREKFRLLDSLCRQLNGDELTNLERAILAGVPRAMFREDLSDEEWQESNERQIWLHLAKLESFKVTLSEEAKAIYDNLSKKYPQWKLHDGERNEFNTWFSTGRGNRCDITRDELIALPIQQRIEKLLEPTNDYPNERISLFVNICKDKPDFALETLGVLTKQSNWDTSIWHSGLMALSEANNTLLWLKTAKLIAQLPGHFFEKEAWVISWWIRKTIDSITVNSEEETYFWQLFDLLIAHAQPVDIKEDVINQSINNPIGILTEAFLSRFTAKEIKAKETIPKYNLLSRLNILVNDKSKAFILARVILVSRLHYFYVIDPEWTRNNLIPLLDWELSTEAAVLWQGWLWSPQVSADLALDLKEHFLKTLLSHSNELGKKTQILFQLFASICFEYKNLYGVEEQKTVLNAIGKKGLQTIARFIEHSLGEDTQQNDQYWKNRIKPFFINAWPKEAKSIGSKISEYFTLMCISLDAEFENAVESIKSILTSFPIGRFLMKLKESQHIEKHPRTAFDLLATVFDTNVEQCWFVDDLREVITSLVENCPDLKNDPRYLKIEQFLKRQSSH